MFKTDTQLFEARHGLSLVEVLIAMVMTLIVLGAMMAAFSYGSAEMQKGRASIELNNRLITAEEQLRRDLSQITVELKPYHKLPMLPKGYFELVEGPQTDYIRANDTPYEFPVGSGTIQGSTFVHGGNELVFGDRDDFVAFTIQSDSKPFRGRQGNTIVESHFAEVAWFTVFDPTTPDTTDVLLIRRQLLILPTAPTAPLFVATGTLAAREDLVSDFIRRNDISVRVVRTSTEYRVFANTLADVALRGNRFAHRRSLEWTIAGRDTGFEDDVAITTPPPQDNPHMTATDCMLDVVELGNLYGENHVMASAVTSFNIQVFDPNALNLFIPDGTGSQIVDVAEPGSVGVEQGFYNDDQDGINELQDTEVFDAADRHSAQITGTYVDLGRVNPLGLPVAVGTFGGISNGYRFGYNPDTFAIGTEYNGYAFGFRRDSTILTGPSAVLDPTNMLFYETYDTGTSQYNRDSASDPGSNGVDDDGDGLIDEPDERYTPGSNGYDDDNDGFFDEADEASISNQIAVRAPYDAPIRGLKFTMRMIEPVTKQVRQLTVKKSFVAE